MTGVEYAAGRSNRGWIAITVDGWIPAATVQRTRRDGFDLIVTAKGGASVRNEPDGSTVARLFRGALLERVSARGGWIRVRRHGWVGRARLDASPVSRRLAARSEPPVQARGDSARPGPTEPRAVRDTLKPDTVGAAVGSPSVARVAIRRGAAISRSPDGEPIAQLARPSEGAIVERSRDWVKVRIEGWVRSTDISTVVEEGPRVTAAMIRADPDRYVGQPVTWRLQFLAIREADELRPEMVRGQPYLLTRGPLPESGFVYVTLSKAQATEFQRLQPLDEIRIEGVIKAGRTKYLPTPVVELKSP